MPQHNGTGPEGFVLAGFSDRPRLERVLFVLVLAFYLLTLLGNVAIVLLSVLDARLHRPVYFFLANLSVLDVGFTTGSVPQTLSNLRGPDNTISYLGGAGQLYFVLALGGVDASCWRSWPTTTTWPCADH